MLSSDLNDSGAGSGSIVDADIRLIKAVQDYGDITAFTGLINMYKQRVFNFCLRYTGSRDEAEDISQEVFIKLYRNINSFRQDSSFSTWLFIITTNTCKNHTRWRKSRKMDEAISIDIKSDEDENSIGIIDLKDSRLNPEETMINDELHEVINKAVRKLKPKQKSAVILKDYLGKSYNEIAEIMNISLGTVKSTIARGRINIAKQIEGYCKL